MDEAKGGPWDKKHEETRETLSDGFRAADGQQH